MTDDTIDDDRRAALAELHQLNAEQMHLEDRQLAAAQRAVDYAREHLRTIQRQHMRGHTGAATVAAAESTLSAALDRLEYAKQVTS